MRPSACFGDEAQSSDELESERSGTSPPTKEADFKVRGRFKGGEAWETEDEENTAEIAELLGAVFLRLCGGRGDDLKPSGASSLSE